MKPSKTVILLFILMWCATIVMQSCSPKYTSHKPKPFKHAKAFKQGKKNYAKYNRNCIPTESIEVFTIRR